MWWGLTPAVDLGAETKISEVNILLIAQSDCRHVIQTLAKKYRHQKATNLKLHVFEPQLDNVARSMLFLTLALDQQLGLGRKAQLFMDLYGNSLIRPSTRQYLNEAANRLVKIVTNFNYAQNVLPSVSLDSLKYKDRDQLEHIFKFWSVGGDGFDILGFWEQRVRGLLGTRYDSRRGVYDWDLHMRYRPYGADVVATQEYNQFREKGVAFLQDDTDPCIPNVTLASFPPGAKTPASGYFGDVTTGPYPAFGLTSEEKELLKKYNGQLKKTATEISLHNIQQMLFELQNQTPLEPPSEEFENHVVRLDQSNQLKIRRTEWQKPAESDCYAALPTSGSEIIFLPTSALKDYPGKAQFQGLFDVVTVPQHLVPQLPSNWHAMCKPDCLVLVESSKYVLGCGKDGLAKSKAEVDDLMKNSGAEPVGSFDYKKDDFIRYKISD